MLLSKLKASSSWRSPAGEVDLYDCSVYTLNLFLWSESYSCNCRPMCVYIHIHTAVKSGIFPVCTLLHSFMKWLYYSLLPPLHSKELMQYSKTEILSNFIYFCWRFIFFFMVRTTKMVFIWVLALKNYKILQ